MKRRWIALAGAAFSVMLTATILPASGATAGSSRPPVLVVGHRGASAVAPEHTGAAYDRAVWAGADVIECDLQLTADKQLVCMHDPTVDRTTGGTATGPVDSFTLAQLRDMDFGSWFGSTFAGANVVTLDEQLACYRAADPTLQFYIETKTQPDQGAEMETQLVEVLRRHDLIPDGAPDARTSPVIIQSFDADSLRVVRATAPGLPTALLLAATTPEIDAGQLPDVEVLAPSDDVLAEHPNLPAVAHAAGLEVHTYTVDDPAAIQSLIDAGIDGFFTNDPATGRSVVDAAGRGSGRNPLDVGNPAPNEPSAVPSCPAGMGIGLSPANDESTTASAAPNESNTIWIVLAVVVALGAVVAIVVWVRARRSRRSRAPTNA